MTSHPLYQISHPLYLRHHNLSNDFIPTFVWHHTHYMCDIIWTLYNIISTPYVITLLYLWHHSLYRWNHILYVGFTYTLYRWHHSHYSVSSLSLYWHHHTHSVWHHTGIMYGIFCTIQDFTFSLYDIKPSFLWHHTQYIWHRMHCICVITSPVLMLSQQLNFWDLIRYIWWHHIHCIWHHSTECVSSHPRSQWYSNLCI